MDTNKHNDAVEALDVRDGSDDPIQKCEHCDGYGVISYNPNLNPNSFAGHATCKCKHCDGTGVADYPNGRDEPRGENT